MAGSNNIKKLPVTADSQKEKRNTLMSIITQNVKPVNLDINDRVEELRYTLAAYTDSGIDEIKVMTPDEVADMLDNGREGHYTPLGRYVVPESDGTITAIDNSGGNAWTETFDRLVIALIWLASDEITAEDARTAWAEIMQADVNAIKDNIRS